MADCDGHERTECLARAKLHLAPVKYNLTSEGREVNVRKESCAEYILPRSVCQLYHVRVV